MKWFNRYGRARARQEHTPERRTRRLRPSLIHLEGRQLLATFTVTNTADDALGTTVGSLRWAVTQANNTAGADTINFQSNVHNIKLTSGQLGLTDRLGTAIVGPGAGLLSIDGGGSSRVFAVTGSATFSGLTITGGKSNFGAGVLNDGATVSLTDCVVSGNTSVSNGGGIYSGSGATTTLTNVTLNGNTAGLGGGGLANQSSATTTLTNCTLSGNTAASGGGLYNYGATLRLTNCTVSGNSSAGAGGLFNYLGTVTLKNTIVAAQTKGGDVTGVLDGGSANSLIGNGSGMAGITNGSRGNLVGTPSSPIDARLGALADVGGPTPTMPLLPGSPAIDAGSSSGAPAADQRGFARLGAVDIGAFESQASLVVNTTADGKGMGPGVLSLRQAINLAGALGSGNPATFDPTIFSTPQKIVLTDGTLDLRGDSTTIAGPGAGLLTVSGGGTFGVFQVGAGHSATISGLTIADGNSAFCGGIRNDGNLTMTDCTVSGNTSRRGAGLYNNGTATLTGCTFSGNTANYEAGGLKNSGSGNLTLTGCTVRDNTTALGNGGGLSSFGSIDLEGCTFSGNTCKESGGGVSAFGIVTISGCTITKNLSSTRGGGLYLNARTATLADCTISSNSTSGGGGGLYNTGTTSVSDCTISGNIAEGQGGGIVNDNQYFSLTGGTISGNSSSGNGGGLMNYGNATITDCTISGNTTSKLGGGLFNIARRTLSLSGCTVSDNSAPTGNGGGLFTLGLATIDDGLFDSNSAQNGGGIFNDVTGALGLSDCTLSGNTATGNGGGVSNYGQVTLSGSTLQSNVAANLGGALYNSGGGLNGLYNCTINANTAANGGGIANGGRNETALKLSDCTVSSNTATTAGGGLFNSRNSKLTLSKTTVSGNKAPNATGGGLYNRGSLSLSRCTVSGNSGTTGGGLYNRGSTNLRSTIVAGNSKQPNGAGAPSDLAGDAVSASFSLIGIGGSGGLVNGVAHNLVGVSNPGLGPLGDYGGLTRTIPLLPGSPAINAGTAAVGASTDQRGKPIVGLIDIGAFESQGFVLTPAPGSTPQRALRSTAFPNPLALTVRASNPVEPVDGGFVTFRVPASGASAVLSSGAVKIVGGQAAVTATANAVAGSYAVNASASGVPGASFSLTNLPGLTRVAVGFGNQTFVVSPGGRDLPWSNIRTVRLTFDGDVSGLLASDLALNGSSFGNYLAGGTVSFDAASRTVTLGLSQTSEIGSDGWTKKVGKGGDRVTVRYQGTSQTFAVLPGDFDGNGVVNLKDIQGVATALNGPYNVLADLNGDGVVNSADVALSRKWAGSKLL